MAATTAWGLGSVERRSTTDQVLQELRTAILEGRIRPNEQLPEAALARTFGTGRSAIREALRQLIQEGLVATEINRGAWVRALSSDDIVDVYRAREGIEVAAVEVVLERDGERDLTSLQQALDGIRAVCGSGGTEPPSHDLRAADLDFHRALVALADSPRLTRAHEPLAAECQMLLNWHPGYLRADYVKDHQVLLDAFATNGGDPVAAVRAHLRLTVSLLVAEAERLAARLATADPLVEG